MQRVARKRRWSTSASRRRPSAPLTNRHSTPETETTAEVCLLLFSSASLCCSRQRDTGSLPAAVSPICNIFPAGPFFSPSPSFQQRHTDILIPTVKMEVWVRFQLASKALRASGIQPRCHKRDSASGEHGQSRVGGERFFFLSFCDFQPIMMILKNV